MPETSTPRPRRHYRRTPARWAQIAAQGSARKPTTCEARVHGREPVHEEVARYIDAALAVGDLNLVQKIMAPIRFVLDQVRPADLTPRLIADIQAADLTEDLAEAEHHACPCARHRRRWLDALHRQRVTTDALIRSLQEVEA